MKLLWFKLLILYIQHITRQTKHYIQQLHIITRDSEGKPPLSVALPVINVFDIKHAQIQKIFSGGSKFPEGV